MAPHQTPPDSPHSSVEEAGVETPSDEESGSPSSHASKTIIGNGELPDGAIPLGSSTDVSTEPKLKETTPSPFVDKCVKAM